jgi:hypothetical protein
MAPKSKDTRLRLLEPLATDATAFRAAMGVGGTEIGLVRQALRHYIDWAIGRDDLLREKFHAEREKLQTQKIQPFRLVKTDTDGQ